MLDAALPLPGRLWLRWPRQQRPDADALARLVSDRARPHRIRGLERAALPRACASLTARRRTNLRIPPATSLCGRNAVGTPETLPHPTGWKFIQCEEVGQTARPRVLRPYRMKPSPRTP